MGCCDEQYLGSRLEVLSKAKNSYNLLVLKYIVN